MYRKLIFGYLYFHRKKMKAAFEAVSKLHIETITSSYGIVDLRFSELPHERPPVDENFDPRDHRNPKVIIKPWMAYVNLLRATVGIGMLGAPLAISQAGLLFGPILSLALGFLLIHTHLMLLWCLNEICRQLKIPIISYRYGFRMALLHGPPLIHCLGHNGPCIIALFMTLSQLGICSVNVIFMADNIRDCCGPGVECILLDKAADIQTTPRIVFIMDWNSADTSLYCMIVPILILEVLMKNLKIISHVVSAANAMNLVSLVTVLIQVFKGPRRETQLFPLGWISLLVSIGTIMFNISAVGVILSCEKALSDPKVMTGTFGVVTVGIIVPTTTCIIIGALGFWAFGVLDENLLRSLPYDEPMTMVSFGIYTTSSLLSYPLACYPATQIILEVIKNHDPDLVIQLNSLKQIQFISRPIFVLMTFFIAYYIPYQGPFVAFVGCLCTSLMSLVFPALMEIGLCYPNHYGRFNYILLKDLLIVLFGLIVWIGGMGLCGYLLYERVMSSMYRVDPSLKPERIVIVKGGEAPNLTTSNL